MPVSTATTAPAGAASTASLIDLKCEASTCAAVSAAFTKCVAFAGGNGALQSPTGTHVVEPRLSRVGPVHGAGGSTSSHPQPDAARVKPSAHSVAPTG